ncbi:unnamed protein product [marine sediment metagenome]|uniref:Uncharacterized protein n=1 Tax=marine sediment metagenome TaxID=412755 RepID=X0STJ0_9ZZZZ
MLQNIDKGKVKMRHIFKFMTIVFLIFIIIQPNICATEPLFDIILTSNSIRFNKGENFEIEIYFVGIGDVKKDYLMLYVNDEIYVSSAYIMGGKGVKGLQDKGTNMQGVEDIMPLAKLYFIDYSPDVLNPLYAGIIKNGSFIPPLNITLTTGENVSSGEHTIKAVYMYKGEDGDWKQTSDIMNFHITTEAEVIEYEFMINEQQMNQLNTIISSFQLLLAILAIIISCFSGASVILIYREKNKTIKIIKEMNIESKKGK